MDDRTNTIAGWVLAACGAALGLSIVGGMVFHSGEVEKPGYAIEAAEEEGGGAAAEVPIASLLGTADPAKGADVFKKCAACHTATQGGAAGIGPNLYATLGKPVAGHAGFAYTDALKKVGGTWDFEKMNAWLTSPRKFAPGTKMTFAGLSNPQDRANLLAYLNQQGSNLPLPAAPAAGAPAATEGGNAVEGGGGAAPGAANAVDAVEKDVRGQTGDIANTATPASGAPSVDPAAQKQTGR
ncbi:cytochrome c [Sphingomonas sp. OV641]|uniref:c-type cytochrome n=1 Tax=unclassified Sphingomonas TaxID=196159 RepID=UPI00082F7A65|nr:MULTISPECIES: cytochrome c family protein [unclassified Sphingomonas]SEJ56555.1 cytochrome c [Sphingomonas sp. OV641]